jgi:hypothetical protein
MDVRRIALVVAAGLVVAACGGGDDTATTTTTAAPTTTTAPPTTVSTTAAPTTAAAPTTTTTEALREEAPLTGVPVAAVPDRSAIAVKIDNHPAARPQIGLDRADVVIEEIVEGITRFLAVFHSDVPATIGPVRSARTSDVDLIGMLSDPVFSFSGGNRGVLRALRDAEMLDASANEQPGLYRRVSGRRSPHDFVVDGDGLAILAAGRGIPAPVVEPGTAVRGRASDGVRLTMAGTTVEWRWDGEQYVRRQDGSAHVADSGEPLTAAAVLVLTTRYRTSEADPRSPEAVTTGDGAAWVLAGGQLVQGTWVRPQPDDPYLLLTPTGQAVQLPPGQRWIELVERGDATEL